MMNKKYKNLNNNYKHTKNSLDNHYIISNFNKFRKKLLKKLINYKSSIEKLINKIKKLLINTLNK